MHVGARPESQSRYIHPDSRLSRVVRPWHRGWRVSLRRARRAAVARIPGPQGLDVVQDALPGCVQRVDSPKRTAGALPLGALDETYAARATSAGGGSTGV